MKILCGQLNCSVKLADISTILCRCSSRPQGKSGHMHGNVEKFYRTVISCPQRIFVCFHLNTMLFIDIATQTQKLIFYRIVNLKKTQTYIVALAQ
jgi:hypothetical protein